MPAFFPQTAGDARTGTARPLLAAALGRGRVLYFPAAMLAGWLAGSALAADAQKPDATAVPPAATPAPLSDTAKWLAGVDAPWQVAFQHKVVDPFEKGVAALRQQYLAEMNAPQAAAEKAGMKEDVALWQAERQRISGGEMLPAADEPGASMAFKALRTKYRAQWARLDNERFDRSRALFAQYDDLLAKRQAALTQQQRPDDATEVQKQRDDLRTAWLQPPAPAAASAKVAKSSPSDVLERLRELGAHVWLKIGTAEAVEANSGTDVAHQKVVFIRVEFPVQRPDGTPLVAADYAVLDALTDLSELGLSGPAVNDAVLERLRPFHALRGLSLNETRSTVAGHSVLPALPELRELQLRGTETNDEAMKAVAQCHKLQRLHLAGLPITDESLIGVGKLAALEELELSGTEKLTSKGFAPLAQCRLLRQAYVGGFTILSGMVENLAHCKSLETLSLPGNFLKDADVSSLSALTKLRALDLSNSKVTGAVFATWPARLQCTSLNLEKAGVVDDAILKGIGSAFPKLEYLNVELAPSGFTVDGAAALHHFKSLRTLRLGGVGITDEIAAELARNEEVSTLVIPKAVLSERGIAALAHLPHLTELTMDIPPISDPALKAFGRCKALKTVNIGKDAAPETESKLLGVLHDLKFNRGEP